MRLMTNFLMLLTAKSNLTMCIMLAVCCTVQLMYRTVPQGLLQAIQLVCSKHSFIFAGK